MKFVFIVLMSDPDSRGWECFDSIFESQFNAEQSAKTQSKTYTRVGLVFSVYEMPLGAPTMGTRKLDHRRLVSSFSHGNLVGGAAARFAEKKAKNAKRAIALEQEGRRELVRALSGVGC